MKGRRTLQQASTVRRLEKNLLSVGKSFGITKSLFIRNARCLHRCTLPFDPGVGNDLGETIICKARTTRETREVIR